MKLFNIQEIAAQPGDHSFTKQMFAGDDFEFNYVVIEPGASFAPGVHAFDEYCYCVSGSIMKCGGGTEREMKPGDISFVPRMEPHWCRNDSEEDCLLITLMKR